jgi:hypothetical protein
VIAAEIDRILAAAAPAGWVLEPEAKRLLAAAGIGVPRFTWAPGPEEAAAFAAGIGYPVVAKVVSPAALHKSEVRGVAVGVRDEAELRAVCARFARIAGFAGVLVEEQLAGVELIVGAKVDLQFGPVVLLGIGGTGVEIYRDSTLRLAPLGPGDPAAMVAELRGRPLLEGHRGGPPVNLADLHRLLLAFSGLVTKLGERIGSIDLNPVLCTPERCVVADARIVLPGGAA